MFDTKSADELKAFAAAKPREFMQALLDHLEVGTNCYELEELENSIPHFKMSCVYSEGGGEGEGEHVERVFAVQDGDEVLVYFEIDGYYASYNGTEWDEHFTIVEPYQKTVTLYRPK